MSYVDPAAGFSFLVGAKQAEDEAGFQFLVGARQAEAQRFTDLVNQKLASTPGIKTPSVGSMAPRSVVSTPPATNDLTDTQKSAKAQLSATLGIYGLASLGEFAWNEYLQGIDLNQIMLDIRQTPEYKARFPAMDILSKAGQGISEGQYIQYENNAKAIFKAAGLPTGFYDQPDDFTSFFTNQIGLPELQDRVQMAQAAVYDSNPEALQALSDYYHVGGNAQNLIGDLTAYFIDPNRAEPLIKKQWAAAQTAAFASRSGYGGLSQAEAERIGGIGTSPQDALAGFTGLAHLNPLFNRLPGESMDAPTREQGLQAAFEGNAEAQGALARQTRRRAAPFQQGGGFAQTNRGYTGAG